MNHTDQLRITIGALADRREELLDQGQPARAARLAVPLQAARRDLLRERWARRDKRKDPRAWKR